MFGQPKPMLQPQENNIFVDKFIDDCVTRCGGENYSEMVALLGAIRGLAILHQTHHWQVSGETSYGDHLLFERLYNETTPDIDTLAEKIVGLAKTSQLVGFSKQVVNLTGFLAAIKEHGTSDEPCRRSLDAEKLIIQLVEAVMARLEAKGQLSRGLENLLGGIADKHEGFIYLLKQRCF